MGVFRLSPPGPRVPVSRLMWGLRCVGGAEAGSAWAPQAMGRCPASIQAHLCPLSRDLPTALGTTKVSEVETSSVTTSARNRSGI